MPTRWVGEPRHVGVEGRCMVTIMFRMCGRLSSPPTGEGETWRFSHWRPDAAERLKLDRASTHVTGQITRNPPQVNPDGAIALVSSAILDPMGYLWDPDRSIKQKCRSIREYLTPALVLPR